MADFKHPPFFMPKSFSIEKHFIEARKYSSRSEFALKCQTSYQMLWRKKLLDEACSHMPISPVYVARKWTHEMVFEEAAKYQTRAEFKRKAGGAHAYALGNKIIDQVCAHMRQGIVKWHIFELMAIAIKYKNQREFIREQRKVYEYCVKQKLLSIVCAHMSKREKWDSKSVVLAEAKKYRSGTEFQSNASGAFKQAYANGYLEEACAHMPPPEYGFSKEKKANLYFLRITIPGSQDLFKIGITNREPAARVKGLGLNHGVTAEILKVIEFECGRDARIAEKRLHRRFSIFRYGGLPVMKNGNKELFTVNVLNWGIG